MGNCAMSKPSTTIYLRLEGLALGLLCVWLYSLSGRPWWLLAVLSLVPDLSMLGYLGGPRIGALAYNAVHSWALATVLAVAGWYFGGNESFLLALALILGAHIGVDRALGYGLKLPTNFHDTDLGKIGKAA
jgi:hypothetical protein